MQFYLSGLYFSNKSIGHRGRDHIQLPVQSVPITTTKVVS